jgi:hypothetical protein
MRFEYFGQLQRKEPMSIARTLLPLLAAMSLVLASSASAQAPRRFLVQGYGAYVPVSGDVSLGDGWSVIGTAGIMPLPHLWLLGDIGYTWHRGADDGPDWRATSYFGMLGYSPVPVNMNGLLIFYAGAGSVRLDPESAEMDESSRFAVNLGIKLVYDFGRHVAGTVDVAWVVAFADEEDDAGGEIWAYPFGFGLAVRF